MSDILRQHWRRVPSAAIGAGMTPQRTAEEVDGEIAREKAKLQDTIFDRIVQRAEQGELDAVQWLEGRGFIDMLYMVSEQPKPLRPRIS